MITRYCIDKLASKYGLVKLDNCAGLYHYCYLPNSNIWNNCDYENPSAIFTIYTDEDIFRMYDIFDIEDKKCVFHGGTYESLNDLSEDTLEKYILKCISTVKKTTIKLKLDSIKEDFK